MDSTRIVGKRVSFAYGIIRKDGTPHPNYVSTDKYHIEKLCMPSERVARVVIIEVKPNE